MLFALLAVIAVVLIGIVVGVFWGSWLTRDHLQLKAKVERMFQEYDPPEKVNGSH